MSSMSRIACLDSLTAVVLTVLAGLMVPALASADPVTRTNSGLTLTLSDDSLEPGQTFTVMLRVDNTVFGAPSTEASMNFGFTPSSVVGTPTCDTPSLCAFSNGTLTATFAPPDLPVGGSRMVTATMQVSASATPGSTVTLNGGGRVRFVNPSTGNPTTAIVTFAPIPVTIVAPPAGADLAVNLKAAGHFLFGPHVTYTVTTTNNGPSAATSATVTLQLPDDLVSIASTPCTLDKPNHRVTCPVGALASGATRTIVFDAYYQLLTFGTLLPATATRSDSAPMDPNTANDSSSVICHAVTSLYISCP